jgi:hypothetical protein
MMQSLKSVFAFLKSAYSESDGTTASSTRLHISAIVGFVLTLGSALGVLAWKHRITVEQLDGWMNAAATFLTASCGSLYGINSAKDFLKNKNGSSQNNGQ